MSETRKDEVPTNTKCPRCGYVTADPFNCAMCKTEAMVEAAMVEVGFVYRIGPALFTGFRGDVDVTAEVRRLTAALHFTGRMEGRDNG